MSHPDPNHDPENVKPSDILESDVLNTHESDDTACDELDSAHEKEIEPDEPYEDMLYRISSFLNKPR